MQIKSIESRTSQFNVKKKGHFFVSNTATSSDFRHITTHFIHGMQKYACPIINKHQTPDHLNTSAEQRTRVKSRDSCLMCYFCAVRFTFDRFNFNPTSVQDKLCNWAGVPQGSVLGPLPWSLYTCSFTKVLHHCSAEDTQPIVAFPLRGSKLPCQILV